MTIVDPSTVEVGHVLAGQSVLVTGGTGSFGHAFVRRALASAVTRVVVFSRGEAKQAQMAQELADPRMRFLIGDVRDPVRLHEALRGVDVVIHAAALKRVETCEADPNEAVATNVYGTQNVARACIACGVTKAVFLSTDKAAAPNTLYGATKLTAERLWIQSNVYSAGTPTRFAATRYGNVLGSTGSVVPLWRSQASEGKPITITSAAMSRFWMPLEHAVDLVCLALREMRGGEVFVPKIASATTQTLADAVAPGATITSIGLRPGEKLHEMLVSDEESRHTHDCGSYYVIAPESPTWTDGWVTTDPLVPDGFSYRSDTNPRQLTSEELGRLIG